MAEKSLAEIARLCADCGTCQSACPVYQAELSEPNSPRGKVNLIKAVDDGRLPANNRNRSLLYQCLVCGGCENACPNGVEFTSLMVRYRNRISGGRRIPWLKKMMLFFYQGVVLRKFLWLPRLLAHTPLKHKVFLPAFEDTDLKKIRSHDRAREYDILLFPRLRAEPTSIQKRSSRSRPCLKNRDSQWPTRRNCNAAVFLICRRGGRKNSASS